MTIISKAKSLLKRFAADQNGTIAVMAGLAAIPLMLAAGAAIDFARYHNAQTEVQAALDAGALAGAAAKNVTDGERVTMAQAVFDQNWKNIGSPDLAIETTFKIEDEKLVSRAELTMPTTFMALGGIEELNSASEAVVGIAQDKKAEVVLVLDYSGSMNEVINGQVKYQAMKDAAQSLVTDLAKESPDKVKFGLVPFSHNVYVTLPGAYVRGATTATWTGCTADRRYPFNVSDSTPTSAAGSLWNQPKASTFSSVSCAGYLTNNLRTVELTDKFADVSNQLEVMTPYSGTHISLGVEFGYHLLSRNAPFTTASAYDDKETKKFMIVLTDGKQTMAGNGPGGVQSVAAAEANLERLCASAKANGITIMTMAFDLNDTGTRKRLQNCATDADKDFFVVDDGKELASAFDSVKAAVAAQVYLSK